MNTITPLTGCTYHEWASSMCGPCTVFHGAGYSARGIFQREDEKCYEIVYRCDFPNEVTYSVLDGTHELERYSNLKDTSRSAYATAFRELRTYALAQRAKSQKKPSR